MVVVLSQSPVSPGLTEVGNVLGRRERVFLHGRGLQEAYTWAGNQQCLPRREGSCGSRTGDDEVCREEGGDPRTEIMIDDVSFLLLIFSPHSAPHAKFSVLNVWITIQDSRFASIYVVLTTLPGRMNAVLRGRGERDKLGTR